MPMEIKEMKDYKKKGLFCEYEYCIEEQPLEHGKLSCPVWGHDCPGGIEKLKTCNKRITDIPEERMYKGKINERGEAIEETELELAMNTKEAIEKLTNGSNVFNTDSIFGINILELIDLLKRGEKLKIENIELKKYKAIWEEFVDIDTTDEEVIDLEALERKHFPEGIKREMKFEFPKEEK